MTHEDDEIVQAFLDESRENLEQLDRDLVELETAPADPLLLARIFRTVHTIKGTCGFLGYAHLEELTHAGENVLAALRAGELALDAALTTTLLELVDAVRATLHHIELTGGEPDVDNRALIEALDGHLHTGRVSSPSGTPKAEQPAARPRTDVGPPAPAVESTESTVRVDVAALDSLMDLVGELVLVRGRLGELAADSEALGESVRQLALVSADLQDSVMRARLQKLGRVTGKLPRAVRDVADGLGKQVLMDVDGADVAVDKAINEGLRDPLLHLVRNSVDHGIELPADRVVAGKPASGRIAVRAWHEAGRLQVELSDDGAGIDVERLTGRAVSAGVLTADAAAHLPRREALRLIFHPGLSTSEQVTSVSGRGVGMDVVRANLDQLGGTIDVFSERGRGTTFRITLPLTLSIMPVVVVWCGGQRFAIPQVDVQEVVALDAQRLAGDVDVVAGARIFRRHETLLPLVGLAELLGLQATDTHAAAEAVIVDHAGRRLALEVDTVGDSTDAVVKPLTRATSRIGAYSGVTILSDGQPALILDIGDLAERTGVGATLTPAPVEAIAAATPTADVSSLLVCTLLDGTTIGIPVEQVRRLALVDASSIATMAGIDLLDDAGQLVPLVHAVEARSAVAPTAAEVQVVMCDTEHGPLGVVVNAIDDVVPLTADPTSTIPRRGVIASVMRAGRLVDIVDLDWLAEQARVPT